MDFPTQVGGLYDCVGASYDIQNYLSLSLPIPQTHSSRNDEIEYWTEYIIGECHDMNMIFGPEIGQGPFYGFQNPKLSIEFGLRMEKYKAIRGILESLGNIQSFPPMGKDLTDLKSAYKSWDEIELKTVEILTENPPQRRQSVDSDLASLPDYLENLDFLNINPPQELAACSPVESTPEPRCRSGSTSSPDPPEYPTPNQTPDPPAREIASPTPSNGSTDGKFICQYKNCGQTFPRQNALLRHIASIHDDAVNVTCPFCPKGHRDGKPFNRSDNFQRHVLKQHPTIRKDNPSLKAALERLWKAGGVRTSWGKKDGVKKTIAKRRK